MQKLIETGERERLKDLLRERLIQCGWRDELKVGAQLQRARARTVRQQSVESINNDDMMPHKKCFHKRKSTASHRTYIPRCALHVGERAHYLRRR